MATEPKTGLTFWPPGAMQPDLLFNAMLYWLAAWAQPVVIAVDDTPPGSPDEGDTYIVGTGSGEWTGHDDDLAYWSGTAWMFFTPLQGYEVRDNGTGNRLVYDNGWEVDSGGSGSPVIELNGTSYDLGDLTPGAWHVFTSGSAVTITVEDDSVEPVPANAEYGLEARGSGGVTLVEDNLATIIPPKGGTLELEEGDFAVLKRTDEDEYKLVGSTVSAS